MEGLEIAGHHWWSACFFLLKIPGRVMLVCISKKVLLFLASRDLRDILMWNVLLYYALRGSTMSGSAHRMEKHFV